MPVTSDDARSTGSGAITTNDLLLAIFTLLVDEREQRVTATPERTRTELLLAQSGLNHGTIAKLLGKNPDAVRMMITRARKATERRKGDTGSQTDEPTTASAAEDA